MTTKTVEEEAYFKHHRGCPHGSRKDNFFAGFRACEEKLAKGDGAYNLGYERASSRYRPRKIDLNNPPPTNRECLIIWTEEYTDGKTYMVYNIATWHPDKKIFCGLIERPEATHWCELPKIEGEK